MAKVKKFFFVLGVCIYLSVLSLPALAEEVYTESTLEVIAVDEQTNIRF